MSRPLGQILQLIYLYNKLLLWNIHLIFQFIAIILFSTQEYFCEITLDLGIFLFLLPYVIFVATVLKKNLFYDYFWFLYQVKFRLNVGQSILC